METQTAWQISSKEYSMWSKDNFIYENTGKNALCERNRWTEETWGKISSIQHSIGNWLERLYKAYFVIQLSLVFSFQDTKWSVSEGKKSNDFRRGLRSPHWQGKCSQCLGLHLISTNPPCWVLCPSFSCRHSLGMESGKVPQVTGHITLSQKG